MGTRNDDISLILAKAKKQGFLPDVKDEEVDILSAEANKIFNSCQVVGDPKELKNGTFDTLPDGTPITLFGNSPIVVTDGAFTHNPGASGTNKAGYIQANLGRRVHRIGCEFTAAAGLTAAAVTLVIPTGAWVEGQYTPAGVHAVFYPNGIWHISYFDTTSEAKYIQWDTTASRFSDVRDGKPRTIEIIIDEESSELTVILPDGRAMRATSPYISSASGNYAIWEIFNPDAAVYTSPKFTKIWADGKQVRGGTPNLSPELLGKGLSAPFVWPMVTVLPAVGQGQRGQIALLQGGAGVADTVHVVMKKADNSYAWVAVG